MESWLSYKEILYLITKLKFYNIVIVVRIYWG